MKEGRNELNWTDVLRPIDTFSYFTEGSKDRTNERIKDRTNELINEWMSVCECVIGVLSRFQQSFCHITTVAACCISCSGLKCCQH